MTDSEIDVLKLKLAQYSIYSNKPEASIIDAFILPYFV